MSISTEDFKTIQKFFLEHTGNSLEEGKEYLVEGRLKSLVYDEKFEDLQSLVSSLVRDPKGDLGKKVIDALTTHETSFFRDKHPFETLKTAIIPELLKSDSKEIQIWSAACSSGQEPYSLAMLIEESFMDSRDWEFNIVATEISEKMLEKCRSGLFSQFEISRGLPPHYLPWFFQRVESKWQIKPELRERIDFRYLNLCTHWGGLQQMDVILMRNVLIYFEDEIKKNIFEKILKVLKPGGHLFLGSGETPVGFEDRLQQTDFSTSACFKLVSG